MNFFDNFLQDLVVDIGKELIEIIKIDFFILLKESNYISLCPSLYEVLISPTLRIINFHIDFWFNLSHEVHFLKLSYKYLAVSMFALMDNTEEIIFLSLMIKNWAEIHIVLKNSDAFVLSCVNLAKKGNFLTFLFQYLSAIRSHMFKHVVVWLSCKSRLG